MNILDKLESLGYTDRVDISMDISLFEYGIIRNPETEKVIYYMPCIKEYDHTSVSIEEIRESLNEVGEDFFSFIGSDKETELKNLDNNHLSIMISHFNGYDGRFNDFATYGCKLIHLM